MMCDIPVWWTQWSHPAPGSWRGQNRRESLQPGKYFRIKHFFEIIPSLIPHNRLSDIIITQMHFFKIIPSPHLTATVDPEVNPLVHELLQLRRVGLRHLSWIEREIWKNSRIIGIYFTIRTVEPEPSVMVCLWLTVSAFDLNLSLTNNIAEDQQSACLPRLLILQLTTEFPIAE